MGKWIGEKDLLVGKTRSEVWELLGPPGGPPREFEDDFLDRPFWGLAVLTVAYTPEGLVREDWYEVID